MVCLRSVKPNAGLAIQVSQDGKRLPETLGKQSKVRPSHPSQGAGHHTPTQPPSSPPPTLNKVFRLCTWGPREGVSPRRGRSKEGLDRRGVGEKKEGWRFADTLLLQVALKSPPAVSRSGQAEETAFFGSPLAQEVPKYTCLPTGPC